MNSTRNRSPQHAQSHTPLFRVSRDLKLTPEQQRAIHAAEQAMGYTARTPVHLARTHGRVMPRLAMFAILAAFIMGIVNSIRSSDPSQPRTSPPLQRPQSRSPRSRPRRVMSRPLPSETALTIPQLPTQMPAPTQSSGPLAPMSRDGSERGLERASPVGVSAPTPQWPQDSGPKSEYQPPAPPVRVPEWRPEPGPATGGKDRTQVPSMPFPVRSYDRSLNRQIETPGHGWQRFGSGGAVDRAPDQQRENLRPGWHRFGETDRGKSQLSQPELQQTGNGDGRSVGRHFGGYRRMNSSGMNRLVPGRSTRGMEYSLPGPPYGIVSGPACPCRLLVRSPALPGRVLLWPHEGWKGGLPR